MRFGILIAEAGLSTDGARAIQLALAPVFLLTGIAGLLNVMTARLGRIIDRGRHLTEASQENLALPPQERANKLRSLARRRHLAGVAITACTLAALLTCLVIVLLFAVPVEPAAEVARRGTVQGRNHRIGRWLDLFSSRGAPCHPDRAGGVEVCRNEAAGHTEKIILSPTEY
jgi:hypothetical protein